MSSIKTLNGIQYTLPGYNDTGWGANTGNVLTQYLQAIADVTLQLTGGAFTLTAETDFGANFGLKALYLKSETTNPASAGIVRLAKTDSVKWRNNANGADIALSIDGSDNLTYAATKVLLSGAVVNADINASAAIAYSKLSLAGSVVNADIASGAAIAYSKLALTGSVVNADIATAAAIALTKLASTTAYYWYAANVSGVLTPLAVTASRAVATDANGLPTASTVTATELGYVSGVTSAIQTQLNATIANPLTANLAAGSHKLTGLAAGTANGDSVRFEQLTGVRVLQIVSGTPQQAATVVTSSTYTTTSTTVSITPTLTTSKIVLLVYGCLSTANVGASAALATVKRDTSDLFPGAGGNTNTGFAHCTVTNGDMTSSAMYIDSPGDTSAHTYKVFIRNNDNATTVTWCEFSTANIIAIEVG